MSRHLSSRGNGSSVPRQSVSVAKQDGPGGAARPESLAISATCFWRASAMVPAVESAVSTGRTWAGAPARSVGSLLLCTSSEGIGAWGRPRSPPAPRPEVLNKTTSRSHHPRWPQRPPPPGDHAPHPVVPSHCAGVALCDLQGGVSLLRFGGKGLQLLS